MARLRVKRDLMDQARRWGWRGQSFRKAKRFAMTAKRQGTANKHLLRALATVRAVRRVPARRGRKR